MITTWSEKVEAKGKLELALRLLAQRFGTLPDSVRQKLAAIESTDELAALVERVFQGDSLEELGLA